MDKLPKKEYDKTKKCKCGKSMLIIPWCCDKCGQFSMIGKKVEVVGTISLEDKNE